MRKSAVFSLSNVADLRFKAALEVFCKGGYFTFDNVDFGRYTNSQVISISTTSDWNADNLNEAKAMRDIERAIGIFEFLKENSSEFSDLVKDLKPRVSLIDDYGMGVVELCYLEDGKLIWSK